MTNQGLALIPSWYHGKDSASRGMGGSRKKLSDLIRRLFVTETHERLYDHGILRSARAPGVSPQPDGEGDRQAQAPRLPWFRRHIVVRGGSIHSMAPLRRNIYRYYTAFPPNRSVVWWARYYHCRAFSGTHYSLLLFMLR